MAKLPRPHVAAKDEIEEQDLPESVLVALREIASSAKEGLLALSVGVGLKVIGEIFEEAGATSPAWICSHASSTATTWQIT
jgi:hypothetical protein